MAQFIENVVGNWDIILLYSLVLFALIKLNIWHQAQRKNMTPQQRAQADREDNSEPY